MSHESVVANKARSRRLYEEVFGQGRLSVADEILSHEHVSHGPGSPPCVGPDGFKSQAIRLRTAIPDLRVTLCDQVAEGDRVVSRWTASGTHTGELALSCGVLPASGARISFDEIRIERFADGKCVESWFIPDRFTLWQQLGVIRASP